jgi:hypothetical protein
MTMTSTTSMTWVPARTLAAEAKRDERIRKDTEYRMNLAVRGGRAGIEARLRELDQEWDCDQALAAGFAGASLFGVGLAASWHKGFLVFPAIAAAVVLQRMLTGTCAPLEYARSLGFRTRREIEEERTALKAARGDFHDLERMGARPQAAALLAMVQR